ncbi:MAG: transporter permease, partial [Myxococcales bacterium]|nr:transporter permease [Myxococcales bacterium]
MSALQLAVERLGAAALALFDEAGGMLLLAWRVLLGLLTWKLDGRELLRNLYKMGVQSLPIVVLTAFFTGGIMVIQSGIFVRRFGAYGLLGFGAGYATLREVGPILIGLMFSG